MTASVAEAIHFSRARRPLGAQVRLRYLPSSPERAVLVEAGRGTVRTVLTLLFLVVLGLVGVLLTVLGLL
ncbi:DUF3592 domain-containing protein [Streptomyces sp. NBC_01207]|uniref:DUF3592 domain-containing protein n=1 Tax=Streptomyces sp. NBC_01207 TaxID=2903772 RepID=UPI002E13B7EE|nr:hypothetical protein OG457_48465 [Streptomyces sp. NBC_01207]